MVDLRRTGSRHWLFHGKFGVGDYHHRHSRGVANLQDWAALPLAVWSGGERYGLPHWVHSHSAELDLDHLRWPMGLLGTPVLRGIAVHHHHWHPVRQAAFQDGRIVVSPVWQRGNSAFLRAQLIEKNCPWFSKIMGNVF